MTITSTIIAARQSPRQTLPVCLGQASAYLDILTLDKITDDWTTDERVKNACCAVADVYAKQDAGGEVASESNHGVSRTYVASGKSTDKQLYDAAVLYLANTGLLYRGVI